MKGYFEEDFERRIRMFNALVGSIALYGAEIWGWREEERMDKISRRYVKWVLGLDIRTPNYIVMEKTKIKEGLGMEAVRRAIKYEETARNSEKKIVLKCMREIDKRRKKEQSKCEKKRREVIEKIGWSEKVKEMKRESMRPEEITEEIMDKLEEERKTKRRKHIEESRYNKEYKDIRTEERPGYLKGRRKKIERNRIVRYRCGNEMRGSRH